MGEIGGGTPDLVENRSDQAVCYGFEACAPFEIVTGRSGTGVTLQVTEREVAEPNAPPLFEWSELGMPFARLWTGPDAILWLDHIGCFSVSADEPAITVPPTTETLRREASLWSFPALLCLIARGDLGMHAAAVEIDGRAVVLAAPGMHGKTTLAAAFVAAGHRLLSEDLTCIDVSGAVPSVLPGPALMKLRRDTIEHLELPPDSVLAEIGRRVYVTQHERGTGAPLPLAAVIFLREAAQERPTMHRLDASTSLPELWTLSFKLPEDLDRGRCFRQITSIAAGTPLWDLRRPLSYDGLPEVIDLIRSTST